MTDKKPLRNAVRFLYDLQKLRIETFQRGREKDPASDEAPTDLDPDARKFQDSTSKGMLALEKSALKEVDRIASREKVYDWLRSIKGVGPTCAGFLLSEFDIHIAERPSQFWSFAGLGVVEGHAPKPIKGQKLSYNSWLRSKCLVVVGGAFLKAGNEKYRAIYDDYRYRKQTQLGVCSLCGGKGKAAQPKKAEDGTVSKEAGKLKKCWNCVGAKVKEGEPEPPGFPYTPDRAPWGRGDAHRHQAALRYMVKMFLADFWREWRTAEGLPVVPTYQEAKQGYVHVG